MDISNQYEFYVGTVRGAIANTRCKPKERAKFDLQHVGMMNEITSLKWGRTPDEIVVGYKNDSTRLYDTTQTKYTHCINGIEGGQGVVGAEALNNSIVLGHRNGRICIWQDDVVDDLKLNLDKGATLEVIACNNNRANIVGTGGEHYDFKLWDIEAKQCIFKAKSMGHDELNLPIHTSIRDICFFPHDEKLNACCTKEGNVLLYDERAQRRPVSKFFEPKASFTTLTTAYRQTQCIVGTTKGYMQLVDLKSPRNCVRTFKTSAGSVKDVICDPAAPIVFSISLDGYLYIHNIETRALLHREYLKQSLAKFVMRPVVKEQVPVKTTDNVVAVEDDEDYDKLFEKMETIGDEKRKKVKRRISEGDAKNRKKIKK